MEMRLRAPVTRGYFFLLGALRLVNAASPRNTGQKKLSSGTQGTRSGMKESGEEVPSTLSPLAASPLDYTARSLRFNVSLLSG